MINGTNQIVEHVFVGIPRSHGYYHKLTNHAQVNMSYQKLSKVNNHAQVNMCIEIFWGDSILSDGMLTSSDGKWKM
jgi:hypothetical protein